LKHLLNSKVAAPRFSVEDFESLSALARRILHSYCGKDLRMDWRKGDLRRVAGEVKHLFERTVTHHGLGGFWLRDGTWWQNKRPRKAKWSLREGVQRVVIGLSAGEAIGDVVSGAYLGIGREVRDSVDDGGAPRVSLKLGVSRVIVNDVVWHSRNGGRWTSPGPLQYSEEGRANWQNARREDLEAHYAGCTEVDIQAAHPTILVQLARTYFPDLEIPVTESFVVDPGRWRADLAAELGFTMGKAKRRATALFFGKGGEEGDPVRLSALRREVARVRKRFLDLFPGFIRAARDGWKHDSNLYLRAWSLLLQAEERKILDVMVYYHRQRGDRVRVLQHDGYVVDEAPDVAELSALIRRHTGYAVTLKTRPMGASSGREVVKLPVFPGLDRLAG